MKTHKTAVAISALLLVAGACGGGETSLIQEDSVVASATTTAAAGVDDRTIALAAYLAQVYELGADLVDNQADLGVGGDPTEQAVLIEDMVAGLADVNPPLQARDYHLEAVTVLGSLGEGMREFGLALDQGDESASREAATRFLELVDSLGNRIVALDAEQARLAGIAASAWPDDSEAAYLVLSLRIGSDSGPMVEEIFAAMADIPSDPIGALEQMSTTISTFDVLAADWRRLDPPPRFEDLQRRTANGLENMSRIFTELMEAIRLDEEPSAQLLIDLQRASRDAQLLNAARSRAIAATLRSLAEFS